MAKKTSKEDEVISDIIKNIDGPVFENGEVGAETEPKPGIIKEYTQNGFRFRRIRHEGGRIEDVRIG